MRELFEKIKLVAETNSTVLVIGESGTGKELVARSLHLNSPRNNKPFLPVNCAAIPDTLIEHGESPASLGLAPSDIQAAVDSLLARAGSGEA